MSLPRVMLIVTIVVTVTDLVEYYHLKQHPEHLTLLFALSVSAVTVVPIGIILWFHSTW